MFRTTSELSGNFSFVRTKGSSSAEEEEEELSEENEFALSGKAFIFIVGAGTGELTGFFSVFVGVEFVRAFWLRFVLLAAKPDF